MFVAPPVGILNNFSATTDPTTADDSTRGYAIGSTWINKTAQTEWTCFNASVGAAVWTQLTNQSAAASLTTPTLIGSVATTTVALNTQMVFAKPIRVQGTLVVRGDLVGVH